MDRPLAFHCLSCVSYEDALCHYGTAKPVRGVLMLRASFAVVGKSMERCLHQAPPLGRHRHGGYGSNLGLETVDRACKFQGKEAKTPARCRLFTPLYWHTSHESGSDSRIVCALVVCRYSSTCACVHKVLRVVVVAPGLELYRCDDSDDSVHVYLYSSTPCTILVPVFLKKIKK